MKRTKRSVDLYLWRERVERRLRSRWPLEYPVGAFADRFRPHTTSGFRVEPLPKIIWIFWDKGEDKAPTLVKRCIQSWRDRNPGWDVRVLDRRRADEVPGLPAYAQSISVQCYSDVLRLTLLKEHGGVWADATTFCAAPVETWLEPLLASGFFIFTAPAGGRAIASWMIAAVPQHPIVTTWLEQFGHYFAFKSRPHNYYLVHALFRELMRESASARESWAVTPRLRPEFSHLIYHTMDKPALWDEARRLVRSHRVLVHKFAWQWKLDDLPPEAPLFEVIGTDARSPEKA